MSLGGKLTTRSHNRYELERPPDETKSERLIDPTDKSKQHAAASKITKLFQKFKAQKEVLPENWVQGPGARAKLRELYYDPSHGFLDVNKMYKLARKNKLDLNQKQVRDWLQRQGVWQVTKQQTLPKQYSSYWASEPRKEFQIDLLIYDRYKQDNYKYILCMVDIYSRFVQAIPVTKKEAPKYVEAIEKMSKIMGWPEMLSGDQEFNKQPIRELFEAHGVKKFFFSHPEEIHKNPVIERFHRTLALRLQKWRQAEREKEGGDPKRWYKVVPRLVDAYNHSYHSTIKQTPSDVFFGRQKSEQKIQEVPVTFEVGDRVRFRTKRKLTEKGDILRFSEKEYIVASKDGQQYWLREFGDEDQKLPLIKKKGYELVHAYETVFSPGEEVNPQKRAGPEGEQVHDEGENWYSSAQVDTANVVEEPRLKKKSPPPPKKKKAAPKKVAAKDINSNVREDNVIGDVTTRTLRRRN